MRKKAKRGSKIMISFIISAYNQIDYLKYWIRILNWIYEIQYQEIELVIADDNSSDGSKEEIEKLKTKYPIKYYYEIEHGYHKAKADHMAALMAEGEYLYFLDADTFIGSTAIPAILDLIKNTNPFFAFNGQRYRFNWNDISNNFTMNYSNIEKFLDTEPKRDIPYGRYTGFSGSNYIISKELYLLSGGYPIDWDEYGVEDYYLVLKILAVGGEIKAANNLISYHVMHPNKHAHPKCMRKLEEATKEFRPQIKKRFPTYEI
jgi:glycosyltransferase involved in cell wall biosynthesis